MLLSPLFSAIILTILPIMPPSAVPLIDYFMHFMDERHLDWHVMIVVTFLSLASQATIVVHTTVYTCSNQSCEFCRLLGGQMIVKRFTLGKFPEALTRWHHNEMNVFSFIVFNILNCDR